MHLGDRSLDATLISDNAGDERLDQTLALVWLVELVNSAIETLADAVSPDLHPLLGRAKDMGSAAVMVSLCLAAAAWLVVFWP